MPVLSKLATPVVGRLGVQLPSTWNAFTLDKFSSLPDNILFRVFGFVFQEVNQRVSSSLYPNKQLHAKLRPLFLQTIRIFKETRLDKLLSFRCISLRDRTLVEVIEIHFHPNPESYETADWSDPIDGNYFDFRFPFLKTIRFCFEAGTPFESEPPDVDPDFHCPRCTDWQKPVEFDWHNTAYKFLRAQKPLTFEWRVYGDIPSNTCFACRRHAGLRPLRLLYGCPTVAGLLAGWQRTGLATVNLINICILERMHGEGLSDVYWSVLLPVSFVQISIILPDNWSPWRRQLASCEVWRFFDYWRRWFEFRHSLEINLSLPTLPRRGQPNPIGNVVLGMFYEDPVDLSIPPRIGGRFFISNGASPPVFAWELSWFARPPGQPTSPACGSDVGRDTDEELHRFEQEESDDHTPTAPAVVASSSATRSRRSFAPNPDLFVIAEISEPETSLYEGSGGGMTNTDEESLYFSPGGSPRHEEPTHDGDDLAHVLHNLASEPACDFSGDGSGSSTPDPFLSDGTKPGPESVPLPETPRLDYAACATDDGTLRAAEGADPSLYPQTLEVPVTEATRVRDDVVIGDAPVVNPSIDDSGDSVGDLLNGDTPLEDSMSKCAVQVDAVDGVVDNVDDGALVEDPVVEGVGADDQLVQVFDDDAEDNPMPGGPLIVVDVPVPLDLAQLLEGDDRRNQRAPLLLLNVLCKFLWDYNFMIIFVAVIVALQFHLFGYELSDSRPLQLKYRGTLTSHPKPETAHGVFFSSFDAAQRVKPAHATLSILGERFWNRLCDPYIEPDSMTPLQTMDVGVAFHAIEDGLPLDWESPDRVDIATIS